MLRDLPKKAFKAYYSDIALKISKRFVSKRDIALGGIATSFGAITPPDALCQSANDKGASPLLLIMPHTQRVFGFSSSHCFKLRGSNVC